MKRNILLYTDEDGAWIAEVPSLPGCHSDGQTRDEALANVKEAIELWIEDTQAHGELISEEYENCELVSLELAAL
jgi:predicted RNase H-like HicB family nuclease